MKFTENYCKKGKDTNCYEVDVMIKERAKVKLSDANSDEGLSNPSFMLWALLGLSAEHSYLLMPLS